MPGQIIINEPAVVLYDSAGAELKGQKVAALSLPTVLASDQPALPLSPNAATDTGLAAIFARQADGSQHTIVDSSALPAGASTAALQTQPGVDIGDVTVNNGAAGAAVNIQDGGNSLTVDSEQLPPALVGGRLDENIGAWLGATTPTVGQKAMAASIPVTIASDQAPIAGTLANGAQTAVSNAAISVLAANANRKTAIIQNVGTADVRVGIAGVGATTWMKLVPNESMIFNMPFCPTGEIFAIRDGAVDSIVLAQEVT
jgi:hypothetical protein